MSHTGGLSSKVNNNFILSKKITKFSAQEFLQGPKQRQNSTGPHQGVIVSHVISPVGRLFWICSPVGELLSHNVLCSSLFIIHLWGFSKGMISETGAQITHGGQVERNYSFLVDNYSFPGWFEAPRLHKIRCRSRTRCRVEPLGLRFCYCS